jgi:hypothetical protein
MGKEIDRARAQSAWAVVRRHPGMVLFAATPALAALGAVWWLFGGGWAILLLIAMAAAGVAALLLKR